MIKTIAMLAMAGTTLVAAPAMARPGLILQGPSATGLATTTIRMAGPCSAWKCGFNGVSKNGVAVQAPAAFTVTRIALPGGATVKLR